ncbi:MAG: hypothetical protein LQ339_000322 [Xanthoria mediterranea]|nr:MAG: hypothetical protein LQ339_000322 [Xanthoria mediterranea]
MFYSHEILTSRESGVATVWLVATLGSQSNLKKVNRKAILDVDVPKTCGVIINPEAPMALRLQSNLLYGVSRVYLQQCGYTLSDAQSIQTNLKMLSKAIRTTSLDPNAGKARPDQLVLEDDPAFIPDMVLPGLDFDLANLDISTDAPSRRSSILSTQSHRSSVSSQHGNEESMLGLIIPSSDNGGVGGLGGFIVPSSDRASVRPSAAPGDLIREADDDFNLDPGFIFDNDGNLIPTGDDALPLQPDPAQPVTGRIRSDSGVSAHVRRELEEGLQAGQLELGDPMDLDLNFPRDDDEDLILPQAEAFPRIAPQAQAESGFLRSSAVPHEESSSENALARQQRKRRGPKPLPYDETQELRNAVLAQWNNDYLANMANAKKIKLQHKATTAAKLNAASWVFGAGIGNVGLGLGASKMKGPLAEMFSGDALMQALTGTSASATGKKRSRSGDETEDSEAVERRVRMREEDAEIGRSQGFHLEDDDTMNLPGSEAIEMGRHEQPALEDSMQFPWNRSASARDSRQGSIGRGQGFASSIGGFGTSGGRPSSLPIVGGPGSMDRRASRITSASPLIGRGGPERYSDLEVPNFDDENELLGGPSTSIAGDDFELHGPAAGVDTQTTAKSQWMRAALDAESNNFLEFVKTEVATKAARAAGGENDLPGAGVAGPDSVLFEDLLPPAQNTTTVAAQALLHVLALATKGMLHVEQEEHYGPIGLGLVAGF